MSPGAAHACVLDRPVGAEQHVPVTHLRRDPALGAGGHVHGSSPVPDMDEWDEQGEEAQATRGNTSWDPGHNAPVIADTRTVGFLG